MPRRKRECPGLLHQELQKSPAEAEIEIDFRMQQCHWLAAVHVRNRLDTHRRWSEKASKHYERLYHVGAGTEAAAGFAARADDLVARNLAGRRSRQEQK